MTLNQIEIFLKTVAYKNFTKAGEDIGMTQSAVSHAIVNLEKDLGVKLFERSKKGIELTASGSEINEHMQAIYKHVHAIYESVETKVKLPKCTIRIGVFSSISSSILPKIIRTYNEIYPQVKIALFEGTDQEIIEWLDEGVVDIAFITLPNEKYYSKYVIQDEMKVILSEGHPLSRYKSVDLKQLGGEPFIMSNGGCEPFVLEILENGIQGDGGWALPEISYRVNHVSTIIQMVREALGVSIVPELSIRNEQMEGVIVKSLRPPVYRRIAIASRKVPDENPVIKTFIDKVSRAAQF
ncbi:LysR family transcriptional regulator [Fusibacter ferrireducens]|uniref:LysR family transcriptional regulator n=1 Tax=Fusibacter ferrireducens TaxID=2785058 RepID=A0ABR9ZP30_9FIRM|nr:LysR family transcriptional regulator [Fusibacter ferrireducens]MBF4691680.1 LysR family transcriptional regulator [Fusibacter ferrireducens]